MNNNYGYDKYRFFLKLSDYDKGWVYLYTEGDFEDSGFIRLWNEMIPGDIIDHANKSDFVEINESEYKYILGFDIDNEWNSDRSYEVLKKYLY